MILGIGTGDSAGFGLKDFTWYQYLFTQFRAIFAYTCSTSCCPSISTWIGISRSRARIFDHGAIFGLAALLALAAARLALPPPLSAGRLRLLRLPGAAFAHFEHPAHQGPDRRSPHVPAHARPDSDRHRSAAPPEGGAQGAGPGAAALVVAAALATHARAEVWSDPVLLWQDTALKSPDKFRAHFQLAFAYFEQGRFDLAVAEFQKTAELATAHHRSAGRLGTGLRRL